MARTKPRKQRRQKGESSTCCHQPTDCKKRKGPNDESNENGQNKKAKKKTQVDFLKEVSIIGVDCSNIREVNTYRRMVQDINISTASLYLNVKKQRYLSLIDTVVNATHPIDEFSVKIASQALRMCTGYVSIELDARLSFDTKSIIDKARGIMKMFEEEGVNKDRVLLKIASTWEGIEAARCLQQEGIQCNMVLLFNLVQAVACAEAGVTMVSPVIQNITDIEFVKNIFNYYKKFGYKTLVMGTCLNEKRHILQLAGCDRLMISPALLRDLQHSSQEFERVLDSANPMYDGEKNVV